MSDRWQKELEQLREARRKEIINAAKELFLERDLPGVTMTDIEERAGISRVTLYKYYKSIHEIAFEVQMRVLAEVFGEEVPTEGATGLEGLRNWLHHGISMSIANPNPIRFVALFDHYYRSAYPDPKLQEEYRRFLHSMRGFGRFLSAGVADGSIRTDIEPLMLAMLLANSYLGMLQRLIVRGDIIKLDSGFEPEALLHLHVDMLISYLKPVHA